MHIYCVPTIHELNHMKYAEASLGMPLLEVAVEELPHNKNNPFGLMKEMETKKIDLMAKENTNAEEASEDQLTRNHIKGVTLEDKEVSKQLMLLCSARIMSALYIHRCVMQRNV